MQRSAFALTVHAVDEADAAALDALARGERLDGCMGGLATFFLIKAAPRGWVWGRT
jgi:hypothetical protein